MKGRNHGMGRFSWLVAPLVLVTAMIAASGCNPLGACDGTSDILGTYYCYDDWTEDECDEYDALEVNDARWTFHAGLTCAEL